MAAWILGLGVLIGRVGMVSLCQFVLAAYGAWVALRLSYATSLPFPLLVIIAGLITACIGVLIGLPATSLLPRPSIAKSDVAYYRYCVVVAAVMFVIAAWHVRRKPGRAWASLRQSESSAHAAGVNTTVSRLGGLIATPLLGLVITLVFDSASGSSHGGPFARATSP